MTKKECKYCGGELKQTTPGHWQCRECGRGVSGKYLHSDE